MGQMFGNRLREWRADRGLTIYAISKATGVSSSNLVSIEKGRRPASDEVLQKLAGLPELEVSYKTLKGWQALDDYSNEAIIEALKALYPNPNDLYRVIKSVLDEVSQNSGIDLGIGN